MKKYVVGIFFFVIYNGLIIIIELFLYFPLVFNVCIEIILSTKITKMCTSCSYNNLFIFKFHNIHTYMYFKLIKHSLGTEWQCKNEID